MNTSAIISAQPGAVLWDTDVPGLHLRAFRTKKAWYLVYRHHGIQRKPRLGDWGVLTLANARAVARAMLVALAHGEDPSAARQAARAEATVAEVFAACATAHWAREKYVKSGWAKEAHRLYTREIAPVFGSRRLSAIQVENVEAWQALYLTKPTTGNRALSVLSKLFVFAQRRRLIAQGINPCALVEKHPERVRDRRATAAEMDRIGPILEREEAAHPLAVAFIKLLIYTGSRPRALERSTWNNLERVAVEDSQAFGILTFDGKTGREVVVIPPQGMAIIDRLPRGEGTDPILGIKMPRKLWARIRKEAGCPDLWARDWRRTFISEGVSDGQGLAVMGKLANHKTVETTSRHYLHVETEEKMRAAEATAAQMEKRLKGR